MLGTLNTLAVLLPTYPNWVRFAMIGSLLLWGAVYLVLLMRAPAPSLTLVRFSAVRLADAPDSLAFEVLLNNPTGQVATIGRATLHFFGDSIPEGGLSSGQSVSTVYTVTPDGKLSDGGPVQSEARLVRPYAGQPYQTIRLDLAQTIEDKKGDRFVIRFAGPTPIDPAHRQVQIDLEVNGRDRLKATAPLR
jgi:hypothetical protein